MQDTELFLSLAEIAGVFVGFGALISVRTGGAMEVSEINTIRWVMTIAIWVVIVALAPIIVSSYDIADHELWLACSLLALAILVVMIIVYGRTPENRAEFADVLSTTPRAEIALVMGPTFVLPLALLVLALALVVLGPFANQEQALYLTAVALGLFMGALGLFVGVFWQGRPSAPSNRAGLSATGSSSA
jgi:hypothetical protein